MFSSEDHFKFYLQIVTVEFDYILWLILVSHAIDITVKVIIQVCQLRKTNRLLGLYSNYFFASLWFNFILCCFVMYTFFSFLICNGLTFLSNMIPDLIIIFRFVIIWGFYFLLIISLLILVNGTWPGYW